MPASKLLTVLCLLCVAGFVSSVRAQTKIEMQTCEDLKITKKQYGINVVETAVSAEHWW